MFNNQYGVAAYDQLRQQGLSRRRLDGAVAEGWLSRQGRWLVVDLRWSGGDDPDAQWRRELYSAFYRCSGRQRSAMVAFRRTAAALWGFDGVEPRVVEFAVSVGRPEPGRSHRVRALALEDRKDLHGLPVTSVTRTLIDLGQVVGPDVVERAVESALRRRYVSVGDLSAAVSAVPSLRGTAALRRLLARRPPGAPATGSDAETLFVQLARRTALPEPQRQFPVPTAEGTFRIDFAWPAQRIAVEVDGAGTHASREALARDLRRQNRLMLSLASEGWALLRFTWDDIVNARHADQVSARLREAWAIGTRRPIRP